MQTLENIIKDKKKNNQYFSDLEIIRIAANIVLGLLQTHHKGVHYRHLKPGSL